MCAIDDNPIKKNKRLCGVPIVGNRYDIPEAVREYGVTDIVFAIPACNPTGRKEILDICMTTGCKVQTLPSIYQLASGEISVSKLREVDVQDLFGKRTYKS